MLFKCWLLKRHIVLLRNAKFFIFAFISTSRSVYILLFILFYLFELYFMLTTYSNKLSGIMYMLLHIIHKMVGIMRANLGQQKQ